MLPFDLQTLYPNSVELHSLVVPFQEEEVKAAVMGLAKGKASGPNGLPSEFLQIYWDDMKTEIISITEDFFHHRSDLRPVNQANIVMIAKKDGPETVHDYRPISILSLIPKVISKVLANRLRQALPDLISLQQTAFIRDRQIAENFIATRELLHHIEAVLIKVDFTKAFDSVNWQFLYKVMRARGFPQKWIDWIQTMLQTSSSRVIINGEPSDFFYHLKGLRQGDPLSPMLFNIAVDVFQKMIQWANGNLAAPITNRVR